MYNVKHELSDDELRYEQVFNNNYFYLTNILMNRFEWSNLPNGIEERYIERCLIENGIGMFYRNNIHGLVFLPCHQGYGYNIYGEPLSYQVRGYGGTALEGTVNIEEGVLIRNNKLCKPSEDYIKHFARRLTEIDITCDINVLGQRTPYFIMTDDATLLTMKNIWKQIRHGAQAIFSTKIFQEEQTIVHHTLAPFVSDKLSDLKNVIMNEFYTFCGIDNVAVDKKERLVTDEAVSNNHQIVNSIELMLTERKEAVEKINAKFGLNIVVEIRNDIREKDVEQIEPKQTL